ncbi:hypothetical protein CBL_21360, partial [Carabus blaptoides fortunei]
MRKGNGGSVNVDLPQIQTAGGVADSWDAGANMLLATFFPGVGDTDEEREQQQPRTVEQDASRYLQLVHEWGEWADVPVSASKSVTMQLRGRVAANRPPVVKVAGHSYCHVSLVKYLGVTAGSGMNFRPHLEAVHAKLARTVGVVRRVLKRDWGLGRRACRLLYRGLFQTCVLHSCSVWGDVLNCVVYAAFPRPCVGQGHRRPVRRAGTDVAERESCCGLAIQMGGIREALRLNYILTGHGGMNGFLHQRGLEEDPGCACGVGEENWEHVLFQCMLYADLRDLHGTGNVARVNEEYDMGGQLTRKGYYERAEEFARAAFGRRDDALRARLVLA